MIEGLGGHRQLPDLGHRAPRHDRGGNDHGLIVEDRRMTEPLVVLLACRRIGHPHRRLPPVECQALHDAGQSQAVVPVEMGDADLIDAAGGDAGHGQLALRALARVEHDADVVPQQEEGVVRTFSGRHLGGRAQHHDLSGGHGAVRSKSAPCGSGGW